MYSALCEEPPGRTVSVDSVPLRVSTTRSVMLRKRFGNVTTCRNSFCTSMTELKCIARSSQSFGSSRKLLVGVPSYLWAFRGACRLSEVPVGVPS